MASKLALTLAAASSVSALAVRGDGGCQLTMNTGGAVEYPVGQHASGQTRAGSNLEASQFTLGEDGSLTDAQGRGCWWTPPSKVLQCDPNQTPETGFEIGCDGAVSFNGKTSFWECDAGENGEVNIYLDKDDNAQDCHEITLTAEGCHSSDCEAATSSTEAASYPTSAPPASYPTSAPPPPYPTTAPPATTSAQQPVPSTESCPAQQPSVSVSTVVSTVTETVTQSCGTETQTVPGPTETISSPPQTVSQIISETVPGPTETVSSPPQTISEIISETVPGPTEYETVSSPPQTVSEIISETIPGPTETVPGPTETVSSPPQTVSKVISETVPGPTQTVSESVPGPTETVPGPTEYQPTTVPSPPETETIQTTLTASEETSAPGYPTAPQPTTLSSITKPATSAPAPSYPVSSAPAPSYPVSSAPAPSYPASSPTTAAPSTPAQSSGGFPQPSEVTIPDSCPGDVNNAGEFNLPSLIIPVDSSQPDSAAGTSYFGEVSASKSSVFDFNVPQSASGKTCNLVFLFPTQDTLETSSFTFSGSGALDFARLAEAVDEQTSYSNLPEVSQDLGKQTVAPGNAYDVASFDCPAGGEVSIQVSATDDTSLRFFQDYNPCPIGLFITTS